MHGVLFCILIYSSFLFVNFYYFIFYLLYLEEVIPITYYNYIFALVNFSYFYLFAFIIQM